MIVQLAVRRLASRSDAVQAQLAWTSFSSVDETADIPSERAKTQPVAGANNLKHLSMWLWVHIIQNMFLAKILIP